MPLNHGGPKKDTDQWWIGADVHDIVDNRQIRNFRLIYGAHQGKGTEAPKGVNQPGSVQPVHLVKCREFYFHVVFNVGGWGMVEWGGRGMRLEV